MLGRRVVKLLASAGHEVTGVARSEAKASHLREAGATPVTVDLFNAAAVIEATRDSDAIVNLATHIPSSREAAKPSAWNENDRIRREISANLATAATAGGASKLIQESIVLTYPDRGEDWIGEDTELEPARSLECMPIAEANALGAADAAPVVLRFGLLYAPDATHTREQARMAQRGLAPVIGSADGYSSVVAADDAAGAVPLALTAPSGTYNVVDDEPLTRRELAGVYAASVGRQRASFALARLTGLAGDKRTGGIMRSLRVSNARFKQATGWQPQWRSARTGLPVAIAEILDENGGH